MIQSHKIKEVIVNGRMDVTFLIHPHYVLILTAMLSIELFEKLPNLDRVPSDHVSIANGILFGSPLGRVVLSQPIRYGPKRSPRKIDQMKKSRVVVGEVFTFQILNVLHIKVTLMKEENVDIFVVVVMMGAAIMVIAFVLVT